MKEKFDKYIKRIFDTLIYVFMIGVCLFSASVIFEINYLQLYIVGVNDVYLVGSVVLENILNLI